MELKAHQLKIFKPINSEKLRFTIISVCNIKEIIFELKQTYDCKSVLFIQDCKFKLSGL